MKGIFSRTALVVLSLLLLGLANPGTAKAVTYEVINLGTLGGGYSVAHGINDSGQVVGVSSLTGGPDQHAFLYSGGGMQDLGTLGGGYSVAHGINNSGQVVGSSHFTADQHAFLYSGGVMLDLNDLLGESGSEWDYLYEAQDVNDAGWIVGSGYIDGMEYAFLAKPAAVPIPGAVWLLGSGLIGLVGLRRKFNK